LLCMVVQLLKFTLIYQKSAKFWVSIPTKKSSWIWRVKFGMPTHIPWTETLILAAAGRQNSHNQSTWNTCMQANTASIQIKNHQWEEGGGERESELLWLHKLVHHKTFAARFRRAINLRAPSDHWRLGSSINLIKNHEHLFISCQMNDIGGN
jgi:hypothetical protein